MDDQNQNKESFDVAVFPGDPNRGQDHEGWMFSIRFRGEYIKPEMAAKTRLGALIAAGHIVETLIKEKGTQDNV